MNLFFTSVSTMIERSGSGWYCALSEIDSNPVTNLTLVLSGEEGVESIYLSRVWF